jgi:diadenosine tetraphosphate (Ap4A) HIT family hydrolase
MSTAIHRRVEALRAQRDPTLIAKLPSGWAVMGDPQVIRGYCLLLPDPVVPNLNALTGTWRAQFLVDMGNLGDAVLHATAALRINYAIFGNQDPALHAHVIPRRRDEPEAVRTSHPWAYDWSKAPAYDTVRDRELQNSIRGLLTNDR